MGRDDHQNALTPDFVVAFLNDSGGLSWQQRSVCCAHDNSDRGQICSREANDEADQVYFDQWIKEYPQSYIAYSARGRFHYGLVWQARGQKFIQDTPEANINKSRVLFAKAEADCRQALKLNPNLLSAHYDLMGILMHGARDKEMRTVWKNAVSSNRKSYYLHQRFMTSLQPRWGGSYKKMASYAAMVTKKLTENPRNASLPGFLYRDMAKVYYGKKNYEKAEELYSKALEYGPITDWLTRRAFVYSKQKEYDKAIEDLSRAIHYSPNSSKYYRWRGKQYMRAKQFNLALSDFIRATELNDQSTKAWNALGWSYWKTNRNDHAVAAFRKTLNLDRKDAYALRMIDRIYIDD